MQFTNLRHQPRYASILDPMILFLQLDGGYSDTPYAQTK
jgi:hypothetical protein